VSQVKRRVGWLLLFAFLIGGCGQPAIPTPPTALAGATALADRTGAAAPPGQPTAIDQPIAVTAQHIGAAPSPATVDETMGSGPAATVIPGTTTGASKLQAAFDSAAREFGVPERILLAVAYNESRWEQHGGSPSADGGYGVMHLTDVSAGDTSGGDSGNGSADATPVPTDLSLHSLHAAADLLGLPADTLKSDPAQNVRGGAALLAEYARDTVGTVPTNLGDWYGAVAKYRSSPDAAVAFDFADTVYQTIHQGASRVTTDGESVTLSPAAVSPNRSTADALHLQTARTFPAECPSGVTCNVVPASFQTSDATHSFARGSYNVANRPNDGVAIQYIVIHDTETSYAAAVKVFQSGGSSSANYVIRSSDGLITQMVPTQDIAHHAGNWYINSHSIGIEHEGYAVQGATWYSETLYRSSAALVRYLAEKYGVPLDRAHIIGHDNVPGQTPASQSAMHWDPGPYWDWAHYLELLGAPLGPAADGGNPNIVVVAPTFATNLQVLSTCDASGCHDLPKQPMSVLYLHTAPSSSAPLIADPALTRLEKPPGQGTTLAYDWGDTAATGERFYLADRQGDWDAIYFGGQKAWFDSPAKGSNTYPGSGTLIHPKPGVESISVYGEAFPEAAAFPSGSRPPTVVPISSIPAGQVYVATDRITSNYVRPRAVTTNGAGQNVVTGHDVYDQIFFNHRIAFVKADDVTEVG
jgi:hypothetical protein